MLSVSPPLHQDFRAGTILCSPGDGWRAYKPPPMPTVLPAFHFLSSLLEPGAYPTTTPVPPAGRMRTKTAMRASLHGALARMMTLPLEVMEHVVEMVVDTDEQDGRELAMASRFFRQLAMPYLYRTAALNTNKSVNLLSRTLADRPELGFHIRALHIEPHRVVWSDLHRLIAVLGGHVERIHTLSVRIPASDLQQAMAFLAAFSPTSFTWTTSPCWQMRPASLFVAFLTNWSSSLHHLRLENFRFDSTLSTCVDGLPHLKSLSLRGNGSDYLEIDVLASLLQAQSLEEAGGSNANKLSHATLPQPTLEIANCSVERRSSLESALFADYAYPSDALERLSWR